MIRVKKFHLLVSLLSSTLVTVTHSHAAGFALIENSASGMGNAFAGAAAISEDPSTIYFNPAGMTRLNGEQFAVAGHAILPRSHFSNQGSTSAAGGALLGSDSETSEDAVVPNLYLVIPLSENTRFGLAINTPFGLTTKYDEGWVGRYHAIKSELLTVNVNPSLAWKVNDTVSLGAGLNIQYLNIELSNAIDFGTITAIAPQSLDGSVVLQGHNLGWGYNLGVLFEPSEYTRIGISYRSKVKQDVKGDADFTVPSSVSFLTASGNFVDSDVRALVELPESTSFSIVQQATDRLTVLFDWTWTRWSRFKELRIDYASVQPDSFTTENWEDSNRFALGLNYQTSDKLLLRTGIALDKTPVPDDQHRTPRIPDNDRRWLSFGVGYHPSTNVRFDFGYAHLFIKDSLSDHTFESSVPSIRHNLKGEYNDSSVDIFSVQLNMTF